MKTCVLIAGLVLLHHIAAAWALAAPKDMAADMVILQGGSVMNTAKIHISGPRSRMESDMMGGLLSIVRRDRGIVWTLYPSKRQYTERPLDARTAAQDPASEPPGLISKEKIGAGKVDGHACTVYRMKIASPAGQPFTATSCVSDSLGLALRSETAGIITELRNIRPGPQPASLFEIPAGYQRTATAQPNVKLPTDLPPALAEKMRRTRK